jgi:serine/threonine-protein kinase
MARGDLPGDLAARYEWVQELGRGAMGVVHRVRDRELGREVALKLVSRKLLVDPSKRKRFEREARVLARLEHPGVVRLFDAGVEAGQPYMAMELLEGEDLEGAAGVDAVAVMLEAADALEAVHAAGVLHRDLKPANLMRLADGRVVLVDFGLANADEESAITRSGDVVGSPYYMAPEVLCGEGATPASDFYSWGVTLYHLLEGRPPFRPETFHAYALGHRPLELSPRRLSPEGPEMAAILACMARDRRQRPTTRADLEALLRGEATQAHTRTEPSVVASSPARPSAAPPPPRRGPGRILLAAGVVGLLVGALAGRARDPGAPAVSAAPTVAPPVPEDPAVQELRQAWRRWREAGDQLATHLELERAQVVDHLPALVEWKEAQRLAPRLADDAFLLQLDVLRQRVGTWLDAAEKVPAPARAEAGPSSDPLPTELLRYLFRMTYEMDLRMDMALFALVGQAGFTEGERRLREDWNARKLALRDLAGEVAAGVDRLEAPASALLRAQLAAVGVAPDAAVGPVADRARARLVDAPPTPAHVRDALALDMLVTQRYESRALACGDRAAIQATLLEFEGRVRAAGPPDEATLNLTGRLLENELRLARLCQGRWSEARGRVVDELFQRVVDVGEGFPLVYGVVLRDVHTTGRGNVPVFGEPPAEIAGMIDEVERRLREIPGEGPVKIFPLGER